MADIDKVERTKSKSGKTESSAAETSGTGDLVCVTGANGFLGAWIVKTLLDQGYRVRGTVRNTADESKTKHLWALENSKSRLELVNASLDDDDCFQDSFKGCKYVIHNASPFFLTAKNPQVRRNVFFASLSCRVRLRRVRTA